MAIMKVHERVEQQSTRGHTSSLSPFVGFSLTPPGGLGVSKGRHSCKKQTRKSVEKKRYGRRTIHTHLPVVFPSNVDSCPTRCLQSSNDDSSPVLPVDMAIQGTVVKISPFFLAPEPPWRYRDETREQIIQIAHTIRQIAELSHGNIFYCDLEMTPTRR